ncbi:MAG: hypothetical protein ABA06_00955 [Parcubacteria bacterium C7867-001]|nr:MAG: hypothetical protein ABA06_00955 [Parcubacteria bacterium C7867-001]
MSYNVALRYTEKAGGYAGVIFWSSYPSKEALHEFIGSQEKLEIVEEGITEELATALTRQTPSRSYANAALAAATDPETGEVNPDLLEHEMSKAVFGIRLAAQSA